MNNNNKKFIKAIGIFVGIVLFLTFFSKTLYNFNLPTVTVAAPVSGNLMDLIEESALITYTDSHNVYADGEAKIKDVYVITGQEVKKGQLLIVFEPDSEDVGQLTLDVQKKEQDIELLNIKSDNIQSGIDDAKSDLDAIQKGTYALKENPEYELNIRSAKKALEDKQPLFEAGVLSRSEIVEAAEELETASMKYEQYIHTEKDKITELLKNKQENISDLHFQINNAQSELAALKEKLRQAENGGIIAETDGIVINVSAEKGSLVNKNDIILKIAKLTNEWKAEFAVDEEKLDLFDGQSKVEVVIKGVTENLACEITAITPSESKNGEEHKVTVNIKNTNQVLAGKKADIKIKTERGPYASIIPSHALRKDANGYYIFVLREENNVLGKNFIVHKVSVDLLDSDASLSAIQGPDFTEPVITASTTPIDNGSRVKYIEAGDEE